MSVAFSPDGGQLATGGMDAKVTLWDTRAWRKTKEWSSNLRGMHRVAFSPDGRLLAAGGQPYAMKVWDLKDGAEINQGRIKPPCSIAFARDGRLACTTPNLGDKGGAVRVYDPRTAQHLEPTFGNHDAHQGDVLTAAFSPDDMYVASGGGDATVRIWEADTGKLLHLFRQHSAAVLRVAFSHDSRLLASSSEDGTVRLWNPATGELMHTMQAHYPGCFGLTFRPDRAYVATGCGSQRQGRIILWRVSDGQEALMIPGHINLVLDVSFSPDGRYLASASNDKTVKIWDLSLLDE